MVKNLIMRVFGSFDGPDGCGKSTLLAGVAEYLASHDVRVRIAPSLGDFLPTDSSADAFRDWVLSSDGLDVAAALIRAASRRLEAILETERAGAHILLVDRGSLTVRLSAMTHGMGADERSEQQVLIALAEPLQELAALDKKIGSLIPTRTVVILPRLGMRTIERRLSTNEVLSDRYFRYLTVLHDRFRAAAVDDNYLVTAEDELRKNVYFVGELLLKAEGLARMLRDVEHFLSAARTSDGSQTAGQFSPSQDLKNGAEGSPDWAALRSCLN